MPLAQKTGMPSAQVLYQTQRTMNPYSQKQEHCYHLQRQDSASQNEPEVHILRICRPRRRTVLSQPGKASQATRSEQEGQEPGERTRKDQVQRFTRVSISQEEASLAVPEMLPQESLKRWQKVRGEHQDKKSAST